MTQIKHKHLLLNGFIKDPPVNSYQFEGWLRTLVEFLDMKVVIGPSAHYIKNTGNKGLTAIVGIETSHIAIHIWDEPSPAVVRLDIYTCGELKVATTLAKLEQDLGVYEYDYVVLDRENGFIIQEGK